MADVTEKERLLREMKRLSDFIEQKRQKGIHEQMGRSLLAKTKSTCQGHAKQHASDNQQQRRGQQAGSSSSSVLTSTEFHPSAGQCSVQCTATTSLVPDSQGGSLTTAAGKSTSQATLNMRMQQTTAEQRTQQEHTSHQASVVQKVKQTSVEQTTQQEQKSQNTSVEKLAKQQPPCSNAVVISATTNAASFGAEKCDHQNDAVILHRIIASSLASQSFSQGPSRSAKMNCEKMEETAVEERHKRKSAEPAEPSNAAKIVKSTSLSGVTLRIVAVAGSQSRGLQTSHVPGKKLSVSSSHQLIPNQPAIANNSQSAKSLDKDKAVIKNAEAKAAREEMLKNIEDMKARLADLAATKKKQKAAKNLAPINTEKCVKNAKAAQEKILKNIEDLKAKLADITAAKKKKKAVKDSAGTKAEACKKNAEAQVAREDMLKNIQDMKVKLAHIAAAKKKKKAAKNSDSTEGPQLTSDQKLSVVADLLQNGPAKDSDKQSNVKEFEGSTKENVGVSVTAVAHRQDLPEVTQVSHGARKDKQLITPNGTGLAELKCMDNKRGSVENGAMLIQSNSVRSSSSVGVQNNPCANPSKSAAKANLVKGLKAAEEKLQDVKKKIGCILKDSPRKSAGNEERGSPLQLRQSVPNVTEAKQGPLPSGTSLKWTPQKKSSEHVLIIGSSPNLRKPVVPSGKVWSHSVKSLSADTHRRNIAKEHKESIRGGKGSVPDRKSQYTFVRSKSSLSADRAGSATSASLSWVSQGREHASTPAGSKLFVSRYTIHRTSSAASRPRTAASIPQTTVLKSRYKLTTVAAARVSPHSPKVAVMTFTPVSARQKAAQVIKSKYKMRRVPLMTSPQSANAVIGTNLKHQDFTPKRWATHMAFTTSATGLKFKRGKFISRSLFSPDYNFPGSFIPGKPWRGRGRGRGGGRQRVTSPGAAYFQSWPRQRWDSFAAGQGFFTEITPRHLDKRRRAAQGWKMHGAMQYQQWGQSPYGVLTHSQRARMNREQQRRHIMHLKRQQWKNAFSLRRQWYSQGLQKWKGFFGRGEGLVMMKGTVYRASSSRFTRAVHSAAFATGQSSRATTKDGKQKMMMVVKRGIRFNVDARGTKLQRLNNTLSKGKQSSASGQVMSGVVSGHSRAGVGSQTKYVVNRVKQRSIQVATAKIRRREGGGEGGKKLCLYFCRFGKCSRGVACHFLHDPAKVAVCTRFLRGTCQVEKCPFSHKVCKEKMPVCSFFLRGVCTRDPCPYLHVKVSQGAQPCQHFIDGFCPLAEKCPNLHTLTCPQFSKTGACPEGSKCRLLHRKRTRQRKAKTSTPSSHTATDSVELRKRSAQPDSSGGGDKHFTQAQDDEASTPLAAKRRRQDSGGSECERPLQQHSEATSEAGHVTALLSSQTMGAQTGSEGQAMSEERFLTTNIKNHQVSPVRDADDGEGRVVEDQRVASLSSLSSSLPASLSSLLSSAQRQKLCKQPAFISLADYSCEESPQPRAGRVTATYTAASALTKSASVVSKGSGLQIKPQL